MLGIQALAPGVIRTHSLLIRSQMLYPIELRVRLEGGHRSVGRQKVKVGLAGSGTNIAPGGGISNLEARSSNGGARNLGS
jgi:hypothetical protein